MTDEEHRRLLQAVERVPACSPTRACRGWPRGCSPTRSPTTPSATPPPTSPRGSRSARPRCPGRCATCSTPGCWSRSASPAPARTSTASTRTTCGARSCGPAAAAGAVGAAVAEAADLVGPDHRGGRRLRETQEYFRFTPRGDGRMIERWQRQPVATGGRPTRTLVDRRGSAPRPAGQQLGLPRLAARAPHVVRRARDRRAYGGVGAGRADAEPGVRRPGGSPPPRGAARPRRPAPRSRTRTGPAAGRGRGARRGARRQPRRVRGRDPAVVEAVGQHQHVGREPVAADVRDLPGVLGVRPRPGRRGRPAELGAAGVVPAVRADAEHRLRRWASGPVTARGRAPPRSRSSSSSGADRVVVSSHGATGSAYAAKTRSPASRSAGRRRCRRTSRVRTPARGRRAPADRP